MGKCQWFAVLALVIVCCGCEAQEAYTAEAGTAKPVVRTATLAVVGDIMVHDYGPGRKIVSFHAEIPANCNILKAHDIIDQMEQDIFEKFHCITTIHMDPIVVDDEEINEMKQYTEAIVKEINEKFSIHDFRMTDGGERINLIFDLVIPTDEKIDVDKVVSEIRQEIHKKNEKYYAVIKAEHSYV